MDAAHVHLMLNHVPVLGAVFAAVVLAAGLLKRDDSWQRLALWTLLVTGVVGVVVYLTGESAEELVEGAAGFSHDAVERHEEIAAWATYLGGAVGAAALGALVYFRSRVLSRATAVGLLVMSLVLVGVMAWTANSGGKVNHPELRGETAAVADEPGRDEADDAEEERGRQEFPHTEGRSSPDGAPPGPSRS